MSLNKLKHFLNTLSGRITVTFFVTFTILSSTLFIILYNRVDAFQIENIDKTLLDEYNEMNTIFHNSGLSKVIEDISMDAGAKEKTSMTFVILDSNQKKVWSVNKEPWENFSVDTQNLESIERSTHPQISTVLLKPHTKKGRVLYGALGNDYLFAIGRPLSDETTMLRRLHQFFLRFLVFSMPITLAIIYLVARGTTRCLNELTHVADKIEQGDLSLRAHSLSSIEEVSELGNSFNTMLDRIERLLREQKEITDNIAHDLRSPLTRINGEVEITLCKPRSEEEYVECLCSVNEEIMTLHGMMNHILDLSSMESSVASTIQTTAVAELLDDVSDIFLYSAEAKGIALTVECENDLEWELSSINMKRALSNIVDNALKYSRNDSKNVFIKAWSEENVLNITIQDDGLGIAENHLDDIFRRCYRGDASRTTAGTGLGLSLVKSIVDVHGGTVAVDSTRFKGSCFTLKIPRVVI